MLGPVGDEQDVGKPRNSAKRVVASAAGVRPLPSRRSPEHAAMLATGEAASYPPIGDGAADGGYRAIARSTACCSSGESATDALPWSSSLT